MPILESISHFWLKEACQLLGDSLKPKQGLYLHDKERRGRNGHSRAANLLDRYRELEANRQLTTENRLPRIADWVGHDSVREWQDRNFSQPK